MPPICQRLVGGCKIKKQVRLGASHYLGYPFPPLPFEVGVISLILQIREGGGEKLLFAQGHTDGEQQGTNWKPDGSEPHLWLFFFFLTTCLPPKYLGDILTLIVYFRNNFRFSKNCSDGNSPSLPSHLPVSPAENLT